VLVAQMPDIDIVVDIDNHKMVVNKVVYSLVLCMNFYKMGDNHDLFL
jgi:hypothetical protein